MAQNKPNTYKGDSYLKKVVRTRLWEIIEMAQGELGTDLFDMREGMLVFGGEGGDISALKAQNSEYLPSIRCAEIDPDALDLCVEEYPGIQGFLGDAAKTSKTFPYSAAHLDFREGLSGENLNTIVQVIKNMSSAVGLIGVTIMRGREPKKAVSNEDFRNKGSAESRKLLSSKLRKPLERAVPTNVRRAMSSKDKKLMRKRPFPGEQLLKKGTFKADVLINRAYADLRQAWSARRKMSCKEDWRLFDSKGKPTILCTSTVRKVALLGALNASLRPRYSIFPIWVQGYHSNTSNNSGTPFVTILLSVVDLEKFPGLHDLGRVDEGLTRVVDRVDQQADSGDRFLGSSGALFGKTARELLAIRLAQAYMEEGIMCFDRFSITKDQFLEHMDYLAGLHPSFGIHTDRIRSHLSRHVTALDTVFDWRESIRSAFDKDLGSDGRELVEMYFEDMREGLLAVGFDSNFIDDFMETARRELALSLAKKVDSTHAAETLGVSTGTIAAWLAHETRGTYGEPLLGLTS